MARTTLFLIFVVAMLAGCTGNHGRKPTNAERFMKGQWVPLHKPS